MNNSHECLVYLLLKIIPVVQLGSMKCWFPGCNSSIKNKTAAWSWYLKVGCFKTVQDLLNLQIQWIFFMSLFLFFVAVDYKNCNQLSFCSGPVLALGLAREDAITGWRHMLGPTEVEKAKSEAPERWIFIKLPIVSFNGNYCPYCSPQIRFTFCLEKLFLQKKWCVQIYLHLFSKLNARISIWKIWGKNDTLLLNFYSYSVK